MSISLFRLPPRPKLPVMHTSQQFPINRIFCIGRNYMAHAAEMGFTVDKTAESPFYFCKDASTYISSGTLSQYALMTQDLQYEVELVIAIHRPGMNISVQQADDLIFGYMVGLDMTRRDLQASARDKGLPWDFSKNFEESCVLSSIMPKEYVADPNNLAISLKVNGETRQSSTTASLIWNVQEIVADISRYYVLQPGDIIFTGTPDGVGPVEPGDHLIGTLESVGDVELAIDLPRASNVSVDYFTYDT